MLAPDGTFLKSNKGLSNVNYYTTPLSTYNLYVSIRQHESFDTNSITINNAALAENFSLKHSMIPVKTTMKEFFAALDFGREREFMTYAF